MITIRDITKLLNPIKRKIYLLVGRAILTAVNNTGKVGFHDSGSRKNPQRVQVTGLAGETLTDLDRFQEYGFEAYPKTGTAEAVLVSPDGTRANAFIIMIQDNEYRPTDGREGESIQYDDKDARMSCYDGKIALGNKTQAVELLDLMDQILTALQSLTIQDKGDPPVQSPLNNAATFGTIQTELTKIRGTL